MGRWDSGKVIYVVKRGQQEEEEVELKSCS